MTGGFSFRAECGAEQAGADAFARHYEGHLITLGSGAQYACRTGTILEGMSWWALVVPDGRVHEGIPATPAGPDEITEAGFALYERLRGAPPFRYACGGFDLTYYRNLNHLARDFFRYDRNGAVLANATWRRMGEPDIYVPFSRNYRWRPFLRADEVE